jgi:acyl-CoA thioester hydrolase
VAEFPFSTEVRVRFAETDAQGVAHHANYLVWFELARVAYLAEYAGGYNALRKRGVEALTTQVHVTYSAPARFDDVVRVHLRCSEMQRVRFRFEYLVERDGERLAEGWTAHACVDARTFRPMRVPEWFRDAVSKAPTRRRRHQHAPAPPADASEPTGRAKPKRPRTPKAEA